MKKPIKKIIDKAIENKAITESVIKKVAANVKKKKIAIVTGGNESTVVSEDRVGTMLIGGCCEDHNAKTSIVEEEDWFPATKNKPVKPIQSLGDATFCSTCKSNTIYKGLCSVCGIKSEETRFKHEGNLKYLKVKYSNYVNVK